MQKITQWSHDHSLAQIGLCAGWGVREERGVRIANQTTENIVQHCVFFRTNLQLRTRKKTSWQTSHEHYWERFTARLLYEYRHAQVQQRAARAAFADRCTSSTAESRNTRRRLAPSVVSRPYPGITTRRMYVHWCGAIR